MLIPGVVEKRLVVKIPGHLHTKRKTNSNVSFNDWCVTSGEFCVSLLALDVWIRAVLTKWFLMGQDYFLQLTLAPTNS